jgi:hypothetical protein
MRDPTAVRAPLELYRTINALAGARVAAEVKLVPAKKAGKGFYACVACASSDALHLAPKGGFKCFSCGASLTNVDVAAEAWGLTPAEACLLLADRLGIPVPDGPNGPYRPRRAPAPTVRRPAPPPRPASPPEPAQVAALRADGYMPSEPTAVYAAVLDALTLTERGATYLRGRGLPTDAAERYGFRSVDDARAWADLFAQLAESFTAAELTAAGVAYGDDETRPAGSPRLPFAGRAPAILIPYWHAGGLIAVRFRNLDAAAPKHQRYRTLAGTDPAMPFNAGALAGLQGEELHIVEGEFNALVLGLYGLRAIGVPGAHAWQDAWTPLLEPAGRVVVWFDDDPPRTKADGTTIAGAGDQARQRFAAAMVKHYGRSWVRARFRLAIIPRSADGQKRDANDLHLAQELHAIVAAADWRA